MISMQLALRDDGLSAVGIGVNLKSGISWRDGPAPIHFSDRLSLGSTHRNYGNRKRNIFQSDGMFVANRVAVLTPLSPTAAQMSPARISLISFPLVACILSSRDALTSAPTRVQHRVPGLQLPGVNADKRQLADKGSAIILNASAETFCHQRDGKFFPVIGIQAVRLGTSSGTEISTTASSSGAPLF